MPTIVAPAPLPVFSVPRQQTQPTFSRRDYHGAILIQSSVSPAPIAELPQARLQNSATTEEATRVYGGLIDGSIQLQRIPPRRPVPAPAPAPVNVPALPLNIPQYVSHNPVSEPETPPGRDLEANMHGCCGLARDVLCGMERSTLCITGGVVGAIGIIAIVAVAKLAQNDGPGTGKLIGIGVGVLVGVGAVGGIWMYRGRNNGSLSPERRNAIEQEATGFAMNNPALR
jgi:hypothetical protein